MARFLNWRDFQNIFVFFVYENVTDVGGISICTSFHNRSMFIVTCLFTCECARISNASGFQVSCAN